MNITTERTEVKRVNVRRVNNRGVQSTGQKFPGVRRVRFLGLVGEPFHSP